MTIHIPIWLIVTLKIVAYTTIGVLAVLGMLFILFMKDYHPWPR